MTALRLYDRPTAVYRLLRADGTLLYVGCSWEPKDRVRGHRRMSWGWAIADVKVEWFDDRFTALRAESVAIATESPLNNEQRPRLEHIRAPRPRPKSPALGLIPAFPQTA